VFRPSHAFLCLWLAGCLGLSAPVALLAQDTAPAARSDPNAHQLQGVEAALAATRQKAAALAASEAALAKETAALQASLVLRGAAAQAAERELSQIEANLATLEEARKAKVADLTLKRRALFLSLAALERLAMTPPGAALIDESPLDLAQGSLLLSIAVPQLERRAGQLEGDLVKLDALGQEIEGRRSHAQGVAAALEKDRQQVVELLKRKADLKRQTATQAAAVQARSAKLAAEAQDLRDLLERLAKAKQPDPVGPKPDHIRPFPSQAGGLVPPVSGEVVGRFGTPDAAGSSAKGILLETRPGATVLAPFDGRILFRGPFRSYGEILIIQHGGGYHSLLAGLARSDVVVGQWVLAGEPVGAIGPSKDGNPKLYMELRRDGHPIDPVPWFGKSDSKVE